jgi:hypothetical protein
MIDIGDELIEAEQEGHDGNRNDAVKQNGTLCIAHWLDLFLGYMALAAARRKIYRISGKSFIMVRRLLAINHIKPPASASTYANYW